MSITATPDQQRQLLDLQSLDTQLTRVRTQLSEIREDSQLADLRKRGAAAVQRAKELQETVAEHKALADNAEQVVKDTAKRRNGLQTRMDSDDVPSRDIQAVTMEIAELTMRIEQLEDEQLQAIQTLENSQAALEKARAEISSAEQDVNARIATMNAQGQQLSKQGKELTAERNALADALPKDLVAEYEYIRDRNHGIGAMELTGGLSGAGLPIAPAELATINKTPSDELAYCPDTGAILVRD